VAAQQATALRAELDDRLRTLEDPTEIMDVAAALLGQSLQADGAGFAEADPAALGHSDLLAGQKVVIEYSSPNTNKPQHLGHCRNNLLGQTIANLLASAATYLLEWLLP
jgi:hypothetical protein